MANRNTASQSIEYAALLVIVVIAIAGRMAYATGGLWLDEAWSAIHVYRTGSILGVFTSINHDNNHHLTSVWLQLLGPQASPLAQRALSIVSGAASVAVAAAIGRRTSNVAGLVAATLFAVSPVFVTYGAEARGYASMTLMVLVAILLVDRWAAGEAPPPRGPLAIVFAIGMLSQLTMLFAFFAIGGWILFVQLERARGWASVRRTLEMTSPALIAILAILSLVFVAPMIDGKGMSVGAYVPFTWAAYREAMIGLTAHLVGAPLLHSWPIAAILASLAVAVGIALPRRSFYVLAILCFPLAIAVLQPANPSNGRYYMLVAIATLVMWSDLAAWAWQRGTGFRYGCAALFLALVAASISVDLALIRDARGDPDGAIRWIAAGSPEGSSVMLERKMGSAVYEVASRRSGYALHIYINGCAPAAYLIVHRFRAESFGDHSSYCGHAWRRIAEDRSEGLSEEGWRLYQRID
ncbi:glycosyltransferase family 39 protein [Sphingomonas sp. S1-29]|uniref:glycosyltransferase family 39 protein n=1 Tax=Sphingomonas sp. S1-29 TaxID=2991074 RepID=UPI00223FF043|nr:glycosyltransferase family 39 protein [Sphingomonas sp. S1-29]UZK70141.1 glycosyltransferase family 39 protein [Sphingomonas sp. S1-29]